jgi:phenylacetate-CoA ligase
MDFFDDRETISPQDRRQDNIHRLRTMISRGYQKSPYLKSICDGLQLTPDEILALDDFSVFPVITRERLIEMEMADPPYGGFADANALVDRVFISPGPVYEPHLSETDYLWARAYAAAGIGKGDVVLNAFSYHMVAAGITFHGGLRRVGATVIPSGTSASQMQVQLIRDLKATAFTGTPSFLKAIIDKAAELGYDFQRDFLMKKACFAAEPLSPFLRKIFADDYGIDTYQMYGATEVGDVAYECREKNGWHICEEVMVEIVDPATGKEVPPGTLGEVVVTRFNDIFFLIRFGTGDLSRITTSTCNCGRTSYRLEGIAGRVGDAVKVRGLFVAPSQLKKIEEHFPEIKFQIIVDRQNHEDLLTVRMERNTQGSNDPFKKEFGSYFRDICTVRIDRIEFIAPGSLKEGDRQIIDQRCWV